MSIIEKIRVDISVVIGRTRLPIRQLVKMGRGAVIDLDARHDDPVWIYANDEPIARGEIVLLGDRIGVSVTERIRRAGGLNLSSSVL